MTDNTASPLSFYATVDRESIYTIDNDCRDHPFFPLLVPFLERWGLADKKCLEIGSSKGLFQDLVHDYTGVDVAEHLTDRYHKPYVVVTDACLPFPDSHFDAVFTYATHEHIPEIELALEEIVRVLKPGGVCLFAPAWHSRPWFAEGLAVRPYSDLTLKQKLRKLSIPLRDFVLVRWPLVLARRLWRLRKWRSSHPVELSYRRLEANYEQFWQADSDACNSLDPFDVIIWFRSRGFVCHDFEHPLAALFARTYALDLRKPALF
jgi:SAM-dependent methyltransferase